MASLEGRPSECPDIQIDLIAARPHADSRGTFVGECFRNLTVADFRHMPSVFLR